jgi:hypothetical protein
VGVGAVMAAEAPPVRQTPRDRQHAGSPSPDSYAGRPDLVSVSAKQHPQRKAWWVTDPFKSPGTRPSEFAEKSLPPSADAAKCQTNSQQTSMDALPRKKPGGKPAARPGGAAPGSKTHVCPLLGSHGASDFPSPTNGGLDIRPNSALNSAVFQTAQETCQSWGHSESGTSNGS